MPCAGRHVEGHPPNCILVQIDDNGRQHMLDLAAVYQRAADPMAPLPPPSPAKVLEPTEIKRARLPRSTAPRRLVAGRSAVPL
jgi:hypothetical protein